MKVVYSTRLISNINTNITQFLFDGHEYEDFESCSYKTCNRNTSWALMDYEDGNTNNRDENILLTLKVGNL